MGIAAMELELSNLLHTPRIALRTAADLSRYFRNDVVQTAMVQYER